METFSIRKNAVTNMLLETFLRGMETCLLHGVLEKWDNLETFLRGMETSDNSEKGQKWTNLETFLRGMETSSTKISFKGRIVP